MDHRQLIDERDLFFVLRYKFFENTFFLLYFLLKKREMEINCRVILGFAFKNTLNNNFINKLNDLKCTELNSQIVIVYRNILFLLEVIAGQSLYTDMRNRYINHIS